MFKFHKTAIVFYEKTACGGNKREEVKLCSFDIQKLNALLHVKMPTPQTINSCLSSDSCNNA